MRRVKGWSNVRASRCRAAHYVITTNNTMALCGAPIRTLNPTKKHAREVCASADQSVRAVLRDFERTAAATRVRQSVSTSRRRDR